MMHSSFDIQATGTSATVGSGVLERAGSIVAKRFEKRLVSQIVVLSDETVAGLHGGRLLAGLRAAGCEAILISIEGGEQAKSLSSAGAIYDRLAERSIDRDALLIALGGGVVGDLGGFIAATWHRGIRLAICPTTIEAAVDASVGGKNALNLAGIKNAIGTFYQPSLVLVDIDTFRTLPVRDVRAGLAESIKHALIASEEFLSWHEANAERIEALESDTTRRLVVENVRIKADFVAGDVTDVNDRRIMLNFGHTIGHAIESAGGYSLRHGECVGLGMLAECHLAAQLGLTDGAFVERLRALLARFTLPTRLPANVSVADLAPWIRRDKKKRDGRTRYVLLSAIGRPVIRDDIDENQVVRAGEAIDHA